MTRANLRAVPRELCVARPVEWPTAALALAVVAAHVGALALAASGHPFVALALGSSAAWMAFTCLHEASHGNVGRVRSLGALVGEVSAHVLGVRFLAFRQIHQRHHRFTNDPARDPDRYTGEGPAWTRPLRLATTDLHYYFEYRARELRASRFEAIVSWVSAVALPAAAALVALRLGVSSLFVAWLLPARLGLFAAAYLVDLLPHGRPIAPSRQADPLRHTRLVELGPVFDVLALGHGQHLLHHLWPRVPFHKLAGAARARRAELERAGVVRVDVLGRPLISRRISPATTYAARTPLGRTR